MGKYAQLANAADCKSVTLAVNVAGSSPALPTIYGRIVQQEGPEVNA